MKFRTVEDIKYRYYSVCKKLAQVRNLINSPFYNYIFDIDYEKKRKIELEKYLVIFIF